MRSAIATLLLVFTHLAGFISPLKAAEPLSGQFHLTVDDVAVVYHNGKPLMEKRWNKRDRVGKSAEVPVKVGDRLVFRLKNEVAGAFLAVQFVSSDLKHVINFPHSAFRELPDPAAKDFVDTAFGFGNLRPAQRRRTGPSYLPFKSDSQGVWGATDRCALGVVVRAEMIKSLQR